MTEIVRWVALLAVPAVAACTYTSTGTATRDAPEAVAALSSAQATWRGEIRGLDKFNRDVTVVTFVCGGHTYRTRHYEMARARIASAMAASGLPEPDGTLAVTVDDVDLRVGCHPAGFGGFGTFCRADAIVSLSATRVDGKGRSTQAAGRYEASNRLGAGAACEGGRDAVDNAAGAALDGVVAKLADELKIGREPPARR